MRSLRRKPNIDATIERAIREYPGDEFTAAQIYDHIGSMTTAKDKSAKILLSTTLPKNMQSVTMRMRRFPELIEKVPDTRPVLWKRKQ